MIEWMRNTTKRFKQENIMAETHTQKKTGIIQTDFHGLIELLAKNLYPEDDMFIRELVQNAHDSIQVRQMLEDAPAGRIDITVDRESMTISFEDNGAGMTEKEITDYLSMIGRSGTKEVGEELKKRDRERTESLIGQFGIGILSAFVAADRLVVSTRSVSDEQSGLQWTVCGGPTYELESIEKKSPGTTVTLFLKPEFTGMTNPETLKEAVHKYADFLPFPIYVNDQGPVNTMHGPWHRSYGNDKERKEAYQEWVDKRFPDIPLEIIPVEMEAPHPVKGVLYISSCHIPEVDIDGMVDIYQARMFIRQGDRNMLPPWAKFVRGVIDSPALKPTMARDAVQEDRVHDEIRSALGMLIIDALKNLAKEDSNRFRRLMEWHHYHIKGMAVQFDDFFDAIADTVIFEVSLPNPKGMNRPFQMLTLPEYLGMQEETINGQKVIYFISELGAAPQFYHLCQAKELLAVNAGLAFEEEFLKKYVEKHNDLILKRVDIAKSTAIFEPLPDEERVKYADIEFRLNALLRVAMPYQETTIKTERFAPSEIPAVVTQTEDVSVAQRLEQLVTDPAMGELSDVIREAFEIQQHRLRPVVLHLNSESPIIKCLRTEDFNDPMVQDGWLSLYNNAFMYSQQHLSYQNIEMVHAQMVRALDHMLTLREERRRLKVRIDGLEKPDVKAAPTTQRTEHITLFMMMPFGEEYDLLEGALRQVFETDPYHFQVILARDRTIHPNIFENVKAHMHMVHGFVADVSELNPNVMLELGITEGDYEERPVFILRQNGSKETPADLKGRLYLEYGLPPEGTNDRMRWLADQLRKKFGDIEAIEQLRKGRTVRHLSVTYLLNRLHNLTKEEAEMLCRAFLTIEKLKNTDRAAIEEKTGLPDYVAAMVETAFRTI